ncbi:holin, partial [Staphylococcus saprophyticus]
MLILEAIIMIILTIAMYIGAKKLQQKFQTPFLNPALIASIGII